MVDLLLLTRLGTAMFADRQRTGLLALAFLLSTSTLAAPLPLRNPKQLAVQRGLSNSTINMVKANLAAHDGDT